MPVEAPNVSASVGEQPGWARTGSEGGEAGGIARASAWQIISRPKLIPSLLLESIAGSSWAAVKASTQMFPLAFYDKQFEREFRIKCGASWPLRLPMAAGILLGAVLFIWISLGVGFQVHWIELQNRIITISFHLICGAIFFLQVLLFSYSALIQRIVKWDAESFYYCCATTSSFLMFAWGLFVVIFSERQFDITQGSNYKHWLELKILIDCMTTGVLIVVLVHTDIFLDTTTKRNVWFHIACWVLYAASKLGQNIALVDPGLKTTKYDRQVDPVRSFFRSFIDVGLGFLLYLTGFCFRWFRELQERAVMVKVKDSQQRLSRVRDAQKTRKRRKASSAAEELIDMLEGCRRSLVEKREAEKNAAERVSASALLTEAETIISECVKKLAGGGAEGMQEVKKGGAVESDAEIAEQAFIEMYRVKKGAILKPAMDTDAQRAARVRKASAVRFQGEQVQMLGGPPAAAKKVDESQIKISIDGVDVSAPQLTETLNGAGRDLKLRLLDYHVPQLDIIVEIGTILMKPYVSYLETNANTMLACLYGIHKYYWAANPYHNAAHAANVAHCVCSILQVMGLNTVAGELEKTGVIIAALGHDIAHPGRTNNFFVNSNGLLAMVQNDAAVLEGTHTIILQSLISSTPTTDIFARLSPEERKQVRRVMINMILATDMSKHFELLSKSRVRRVSPEFDVQINTTDRELVMTLAFKAADLGHAVLEWNQHVEWSLRLCEEYYQQGDEEVQAGLPLSPLCDRKDHRIFAKTQSGFLQFVVSPLIEELMELDSTNSVNDLMTRLLSNKQKWDTLAAGNQTEEIPGAVQDLVIAPVQWTSLAVSRALRACNFRELVADVTPVMLARV